MILLPLTRVPFERPGTTTATTKRRRRPATRIVLLSLTPDHHRRRRADRGAKAIAGTRMIKAGRRRAASTAGVLCSQWRWRSSWCWWIFAKSKAPSALSFLLGPPRRIFVREHLSYQTMRTLLTPAHSASGSTVTDGTTPPRRRDEQQPQGTKKKARVDRSLDPPAIDWADSSTLTLSNLQDRVHWFVQHHSQPAASGSSGRGGGCRLAAAIAGGGGHFVSTLAATPGASNVLLQGCVLYDRESWHSYLDQFRSAAAVESTATIQNNGNGTPASSRSDVDSSSHSSSSNSNGNGSQKFQYASLAAARFLSAAALEHACQLSASAVTAALVRAGARDRVQGQLTSGGLERRNLLHRYLTQPVGVACSSALQTTAVNNGTSSMKPTILPSASQRASQAHIVVSRPDGREVHELSMVIRRVGRSHNPGNVDEGQAAPTAQEQDRDRRHARFLEDVVVAHGILSCIECAVVGADGSLSHGSESTDGHANSTDHDDVVVDYRVRSQPSLVPAPEGNHSSSANQSSNELAQASLTAVREAASRILSHQNPVVALVPEYHPTFRTAGDGASESNDKPSQVGCLVSFSVLTRFALPPSSVVLPGSFNPIHEGHVQLAQAAADAVYQERNVIWFELALTNADKPPLSVEEVQRRVQLFGDYFAQNQDDQNGFQWGILLTNAPLFRRKVELLQPLMVPVAATSHGHGRDTADAGIDGLILDMVIGVDTLVRLVDPKYYDGSPEKMHQAIRSMPVRFVVGGRLAQTPPESLAPSSSSFVSFATGHDQVTQLPHDLKSKFVLLTEDSFRVDLSSTEIRRKRENADSASSLR